jgi:hypothetical protein
VKKAGSGEKTSGRQQQQGTRGERVTQTVRASGSSKGRRDEGLNHEKLTIIALFRKRHGGQNISEDAVGIETFELDFRLKDEAVTQAGKRGLFYIVGDEVVAPVLGGITLGHNEQPGGGARAGAE